MGGAHVAPAPTPAAVPDQAVQSFADLERELTANINAMWAEARDLPEADGSAALVQALLHAKAMQRTVKSFRGGGRQVEANTSLTHRADGPKGNQLKRLKPGIETAAGRSKKNKSKQGDAVGAGTVDSFEANAHEKQKKKARKTKKLEVMTGGFRRMAKEEDREELAKGKRPMLEEEFEVGPGKCCPPRHPAHYDPRFLSLMASSVTWPAISARPYVVSLYPRFFT